MAKVVRVPVTNVYMGGDYTGRIYVGPENTPLNVILDTGSSAFADGKKYKPTLSGIGADKTTKLAQTDAYGDGSSWTGAVLDATVTIGDGAQAVPLAGANVSVAYTASRSMFDGADGILGLAYAPLDDAFKMPKNTGDKPLYCDASAYRQGDVFDALFDGSWLKKTLPRTLFPSTPCDRLLTLADRRMIR